jgi:hypothetical protein
MYVFFTKIPRGAKWANFVPFRAWMERRRFEKKILAKNNWEN